MSYTILERTEIDELVNVAIGIDENDEPIISQVSQKNLVTKVEYNLDGTTIVIDVFHFSPKSEDDVIKGIENREIVERKKLGIN